MVADGTVEDGVVTPGTDRPPERLVEHPAQDAARLRPGVAIIDRGDGQVQLGTDPRWSVVLTGLTPEEVGWLCDASVRRHVPFSRSARRRGVDPGRRLLVEQVLGRCGYLVPVRGPDLRGRRATAATAASASDATVLGSLRPDGDGARTLEARALRRVGLSGLGRVGAALALHLATAGVGALVLDDDALVQVVDLGLGGFDQADVGRPRRRALQDRLAARHPAVVVLGPGDDAPPDVVVVVEEHAADPRRFERLLGSGIAHLSVVVREADVVVGPLVVPGVSPCVGCADRHLADADPGWPTVSAALRSDRTPAALQESTSAATAAALAAGQVLALIDGSRPVCVGATLEVALPDAVPRLRTVEPHPGCGCLRIPQVRRTAL